MRNADHSDRYVKCDLRIESLDVASGVDSDDEEETRFQAQTRTAKGSDPDFGGEIMQFASITLLEELSFVRYVPICSVSSKTKIRGRNHVPHHRKSVLGICKMRVPVQ
jgi:hypothetical protein